MSQQSRGRGARRLLALVGTAALALGGVVVAGTAAQAVDPLPSIANIVPPEGGGSIIVHKHAGKEGPAGDGKVITDPAKIAALGVGLDGVKFKLERVYYSGNPIDLTTVAGWNLIVSGLNPQALPAGYTAQPVGAEQTTAGGGIATFSGLQMGLYIVTETQWPTGATPSDPFFVTVPYPDPAGNTWIYNAHVYPKNRLDDTPSKTVTDPTWVLQGGEITWTLNVPVPVPPGDATSYTKFEVTDPLDGRLGFVAGSVSVVGSAPGNYTVTEPVVGVPPAGNNHTLTVTFDPGTVRAGQTYVITFKTVVNGAGVIPNEAIRNVNDVDFDHMNEQVNFGKLKVIKKRQGTELTLQGAQFELYRPDKTTKLYGPVATNSSGEVVFDSIGLGMGADKTEQVCLKETAPPAGYSIIGDGWICDITLDASAEGGTVAVSVDNPPRETPALPLTGSTGTAVFMAGGVAILLVAGGVGLLASRRRRGEVTRN